MGKTLLVSFIIVLTISSFSSVMAQGGVKSGPDPSTIRDPELEKDSYHNLEVARNYFKLKKAYVASLRRCEEIIAGNPNFSRMDEVLFIAGVSSLSLAAGKGKQSASQYVITGADGKRTLTPEEFRDMGRDHLTHLVNLYPQSRFREQAEESLREVGESTATKP